MSDAVKFPLGATVRLVSGGQRMVVVAHTQKDREGEQYVHCAWHDAAGVPYMAVYPPFALTFEQ